MSVEKKVSEYTLYNGKGIVAIHGGGRNREKTKVVKVRFPEMLCDVLDAVGKDHGYNRSELIRFLVFNKLDRLRSIVKNTNPVQGQQIFEVISGCCKELQQMKNQLRRIGINYNQAVKNQNIRNKINQLRGDASGKSQSEIERLEAQYDANLANGNIDLQEINAILDRFESLRIGIEEAMSCVIKGN